MNIFFKRLNMNINDVFTTCYINHEMNRKIV